MRLSDPQPQGDLLGAWAVVLAGPLAENAARTHARNWRRAGAHPWPDHSTIAEFRRRHESEIAELFDQVLGLCKEAGLVSVGVIMVDGTKIKANASMDENR